MAAFIPTLFSDFGKKTKDLFKKKFDQQNSIATKHVTSGDVTLESSVSCGDAVDGKLKGTYKDGRFGKVEVESTTGGDLVGKLELSKLGVAGLKVNVEGGCKKKDGCVSKVSGEYGRDFVVGSLALTNLCHDKPAAEASLSIGHEGISVGGMLKTNLDFAILDKNVGIEWANKDLTLSLFSSGEMKDFSVATSHTVNSSLSVGAQFDFKQKDGDKCLTVGCEHQIDADTVFKAKVNSCGKFAYAIQHQLANPKLQVVLTSQYQFNKNCAASSCCAQSFGLGLNFGDF